TGWRPPARLGDPPELPVGAACIDDPAVAPPRSTRVDWRKVCKEDGLPAGQRHLLELAVAEEPDPLAVRREERSVAADGSRDLDRRRTSERPLVEKAGLLELRAEHDGPSIRGDRQRLDVVEGLDPRALWRWESRVHGQRWSGSRSKEQEGSHGCCGDEPDAERDAGPRSAPRDSGNGRR